MKINKRQLVVSGSIFLAVMILIFWIIIPGMNYLDSLQNDYAVNKQRLENILRLEAEYNSRLNQAGQEGGRGRQGPGFSLFAFLDERANHLGIKDNIDFMRPSSRTTADGLKENIVEISMNNLYLSQLLPFLHSVEYSENMIRIVRLTLRSQNGDHGPLNVNMVLSVFIDGR